MAIFTPRHRSSAPEHAGTADAPLDVAPPGTGHNSRSPHRCPMTHIPPHDRTGAGAALIRASYRLRAQLWP